MIRDNNYGDGGGGYGDGYSSGDGYGHGGVGYGEGYSSDGDGHSNPAPSLTAQPPA